MFSFINKMLHRDQEHKHNYVALARIANHKAVLWFVRGNNALAQNQFANRDHYMQLARGV